MGYSTRLCNALPFAVEWDCGPRMRISLEADATMDMNTEMTESFKPGTANYGSIRELMHAYGVFVYDPDRDYDVQVIDTCKGWLQIRKTAYTDAKREVQNQRVKMGLTNEDSQVEENLRILGYVRIKEQIDKIEARIAALQKEITTDNRQVGAKSYDPERTIFVLDVPREFPSKTMMKLFLAENPVVADKHEKWLAEKAKPAAKAAKEASAAA